MNQDVKKIKIEEYNYPLPDERIAKYPLDKRDESKLLISNNTEFIDDHYKNLIEHLPADSHLIFNETRVIQARLLFPKNESTTIEVFCLEPADHLDIQQAMSRKREVDYLCLIGGARKWKSGWLTILTDSGFELKAYKINNENGTFRVKFRWENDLTFSEILDEAGKTPLPPYLKRKADQTDKSRYQTVFAKNDGSVAAPTASLHFTEEILTKLKSNNIDSSKLTLHVGAGTFKPVDSEKIEDHNMHAEEFFITLELLHELAIRAEKRIIPVGTTSMRALESIHWLGCQQIRNENALKDVPYVDQWAPYDPDNQGISVEHSLNALITYFETKGIDQLLAKTAIIIAPGYKHQFCKGLITNFHQPKSTLLLLVSSLLGEKWKDLYSHALKNEYRFLSYGDGCLILKTD